jgi:enoyl-CoA hydratase/carnithine racemase
MPTLMPAVESGGAREMMLGGRLLDAPTARRLGLVHHLFDDRESLAAGTDALVARLGAMDPVTLAATKSFLNDLDDTSKDDLFRKTLEASVRCGESEEASRMIAAVHERI